MTKYTEKVIDHFQNPRNSGKMHEEDITTVAEVGNPTCGDLLKLYLKIENDIITDAKFQAFGCPVCIACSSATTMLIKGRSVEEAEKITKYDIADALDGIPPKKMACSNLGEEAVKEALEKYQEKKKGLSKKARITKMWEILSDEEIKLDLRGKQCPMTFVYTKVSLEEMEKGQILQVVLDFKNAFTNVPNSVKEQNLGVVTKEYEENGVKTIWIKKT